MDQQASQNSFSHEDSNESFAERPERQLSLFRVGALSVHGRRELCVVRNISSGGLMMKVFSDVAAGTRVSIELKQGEPIDATVQWVKDGSAGVQFDQPVEIESILVHSPDEPRPRMPRIEIHCPVVVREGAINYRGQALDISQGGIRVECDKALPVDADVVVTLPGLAPEAAVVKWGEGGQHGFGFNRVLPVSQLVHWLQQQSAAGQS